MTGERLEGDALAFVVMGVGALSPDVRAEIIALCTRAFGESFDDLFDLVPPDSTHLLARLDGRLIGHACWMTRWLQVGDAPPLRTAYFDAVAIEPDLQGRGLGSRLVARLDQEIAGYEIGCLSTERVSFYQRCGWELWRGPAFTRGSSGPVSPTTDNVMIRRTAHTPPLPLNLDAPLSIEPRGGSNW